jgi:hypothetical protein
MLANSELNIKAIADDKGLELSHKAPTRASRESSGAGLEKACQKNQLCVLGCSDNRCLGPGPLVLSPPF